MPAASSSWVEGKFDQQCEELESEVEEVTRTERNQGILDVSFGGRFVPVYKGTDVEGTRRIDDRDRLQTGRGASMGNIDVRRAGRIC